MLQNVVTEYLTDALITQVVQEIVGDGAPGAEEPAAALNRFSRLCVWQASLQGIQLPHVSFAQSDLSGSSFSHPLQFIRAVQFGAEGDLHIVIFAAGRLHLWRIVEGQLREERAFGIDTSTAIFSSDRRLLVSWHADGHARVWNVSSGELLHTLDVPTDMPWQMAMALSPDNRTLASAHVSGEVLVWDVRSGALRHTLRGYTAAVPALAFSPGGRLLASGDADGAVCLWRLDPPELLHTLHDHSQEVHVLAFDPTNTELLASASHDRTVRLWDAPSGRMLRTLEAHTEAIRVMAFSPDGRLLLSSGFDQRVLVWSCAPSCAATATRSRWCASARMAAGCTARARTKPSGSIQSIAACTRHGTYKGSKDGMPTC